MNQFWISGNLTNDLTLGYTPDGVPYVKFTIANNDGKRHKDDKANFFRCEAWAEGALAMVEKFSFRKGSPVMLRGWLRHDEWEDKEGMRRQQVVLRVDRFEPMERRPRSEYDSDTQNPPAQESSSGSHSSHSSRSARSDGASSSAPSSAPSYGRATRSARPSQRKGEDDVVESIAGRHEDDDIPF